MSRLLSRAKEDPNEGARPLPWLTPSVIPEGVTLTWLSAGNTRALRPNKNMSFCPRAIIDGEPQPFVVGLGAKQSYCHNLLLSIANPRVYHIVLQSGSDSSNEFGLYTFPKSVLQQQAAAPGIQWLSPFALPLHPPSGAAAPDAVPARDAIPKNLTLRFGAHRASVYGRSAAAKLAPFAAAAKDPVREAHARAFIQNPIQSKFLDEEFPDYQTPPRRHGHRPNSGHSPGTPSVGSNPNCLGNEVL